MPQLFRSKRHFLALLIASGCAHGSPPASETPNALPAPTAPAASAAPVASTTKATATAPVAPPAPPASPTKVDLHETAMGTTVTFVAFTNARVDEAAARAAMGRALEEMRRLETLMSEWRDDSDIGRVNMHAGEAVAVSPETLDVVQKGLWAGKISGGVFDITFQAMSGLWKFGSAQDEKPKLPSPAAVAAARKLVDYRKVEISEADRSVRLAKDQKMGLGGIAKGYIVDRAAHVLREQGLDSFLVQAGGDLYGAGRKPDGSHWVSGIQDPRAPQGRYFATIDLDDHAFSTAGDYARSYVIGGKRYHHIIDPRTGYPATACRSVTVWAPDAFVADAVDDAVFILGPEKGLPLVESLDGVGVVIVDKKNHVIVSPRLAGKVHLLAEPTDGI
ncbi:MAG TPA: FAD:protein FMN transferase [Polyangiaceae bacterium]|nr:FAD:protein FMN transferase [Polyangiaceae bacterium]